MEESIMPTNVLKRNTLNNKQMAVSGIHCTTPIFTCPKCGSHNVNGEEDYCHINNYWDCTCKDCGHHWKW